MTFLTHIIFNTGANQSALLLPIVFFNSHLFGQLVNCNSMIVLTAEGITQCPDVVPETVQDVA